MKHPANMINSVSTVLITPYITTVIVQSRVKVHAAST